MKIEKVSQNHGGEKRYLRRSMLECVLHMHIPSIRGIQWDWESGIPIVSWESHGNWNELTVGMGMGREWNGLNGNGNGNP